MVISEMEIRLRGDIARLQRDMNDARRVVGGAVDNMSAAAARAKAALAGIGAGLGFAAIGRQVVDAQREFDKLNSSLITATGSVANAAQAFKALQSFATTTPYSVAEATEAFIKMRNLGLDPSERALRSYGNTASSMGKGLNQMVEAVADAATGEFERLKEFGIKAKQNGDQVSLTFQGVSKIIGNNAAEIQAYLQKIGETEFAGGMERRAATLDGAISGLSDTWSSAMRTIASNGIGEAMTSGVLAVSGALTDLSAILDAVGGAATKEGQAVKEASGLHVAITTVFEAIAVLGVNVAYVFTQVGKELGGLAAQAAALAHGDLKGAAAIGEEMKAEADAARKAVDAKTEAILGASKKAQDAQAAEAEQLKQSGTDRLAQYAVVMTAEQKRLKAKQDILEIENRLNGVNAATAGELKKLSAALDAGAISQAEYNKYTGKVKEDALKASEAYKDQVKALELSAGAIKRRGEAQAFANAQDREHLDFLRRTGQMDEEDFIAKSAASDVKALQAQKDGLQALLGLAARKVDNQKEQQALVGQIDAVERQIGARRTKQENELFELQQRQYRAAVNNSAEVIEREMDELSSLRQQTQGQIDQNEQIGLTTKQVAALTAARLEEAAARKDAEAITAEGLDLSGERAQRIRDEAKALRERGEAVIAGAAKQELFGKSVEDAQALLEIMSALDESARSAAQGMADSFGRVGKAIGSLTTALSGLGKTQAAIAAQLASATKAAGGDQVKLAAATTEASRQSAQAQIQSYGDMAGAAKGFFDENSRGYQAMEAAEKTFRAFEIALAIKTMLEKSGILQAFTSLFVAGKAAETSATVASVAPDVAASMVKGQAAAVAGVAGQATGDPYSAWARMAAMAAVMAGLGFAVGGIGGKKDTTAVDRQRATGTGSVFGDADAKSESIAKAIELSAANSNIELNYTAGMLQSLRAIESSIKGLGGILQQNGVGSSVQATTYGGLQESFRSGTLNSVITFLDPILGDWTSKLWGSISNKIFGGKTTAIDVGVMTNKTTVGSALAGGLAAQSYADMKKDGGWFHSDKSWTDAKGLGTEANQQFAQVIGNMASAIGEAGKLLGLGGDAFTQRLNGFVVDIGKISTKDLKADEIQKQLEAAFSKVGDDMARWSVRGLTELQKVGEGALETLVRVAANYANLDSVLASIGKTFGATGLASIAARERLIDLAGGIDELASKTAGFAENFLTEAERLAPVQKYVTDQLAAMGLAGLRSREAYKQYVLGLDLTSDAQRQQYVALMDLQEAFAKVYPEIAATTLSLADAKSALADAYNAEVDAIGATIDRMGSFAATLRSVRDSALLGNLSPLSPQQKYAEAKSQYEAVLSAARGGDEGAQSNYQSAFTSFLEASRTVFASSSQYQTDFAYAQAATEEATRWAEAQADVGQAQLDVLKSQVSGIIEVNKSVLSVRDALIQYQAALGGNTMPLTAVAPPVNTPIPYSSYGTSNTEALVAEVKALRTEVSGLRADQQQQTGAAITANALASEASATRVSSAVKMAMLEASANERVSPE